MDGAWVCGDRGQPGLHRAVQDGQWPGGCHTMATVAAGQQSWEAQLRPPPPHQLGLRRPSSSVCGGGPAPPCPQVGTGWVGDSPHPHPFLGPLAGPPPPPAPRPGLILSPKTLDGPSSPGPLSAPPWALGGGEGAGARLAGCDAGCGDRGRGWPPVFEWTCVFIALAFLPLSKGPSQTKGTFVFLFFRRNKVSRANAVHVGFGGAGKASLRAEVPSARPPGVPCSTPTLTPRPCPCKGQSLS